MPWRVAPAMHRVLVPSLTTPPTHNSPSSNSQESTLRVYSKDSSPEAVHSVQAAFDSWLEERFRGKVTTPTPSKAPPPPRTTGNTSGEPPIKRLRPAFEDDTPPPQ